MRCDFLRLLIVLFWLVLLVALASQAARFLVVDDPKQSDAIVVLAGETNVRPARALELLRQGMAPHVFLNVEARDRIYDQRLIDIAQKYVNSLAGSKPRFGMSDHRPFDLARRPTTPADACNPLGAHRVLIVTSEFHTRRALMIFRHRLPQYQFSVAAAHNPTQFGNAWWTNREWAKSPSTSG